MVLIRTESGRRRSALLLFCVLILCAPRASDGSVLYVDANATGNGSGSNWCDAFVHLQDALSAAQGSGGSVTEIRVAQGVYQPDRGAGVALGDRNATFGLLSGVSLMGGYAGCGASDPDAREVAAQATVLSGDLNGNDGPNFANYADNSYHVVNYGDPAATGVVIDGFTISGGNANGADALTNQGGGIHIRDGLARCLPGGPTIRNCIVEKNWATHHGAINDHGFSTVIENCIIRDNYAAEEGAGLQIHSGAPVITNCLFQNNKGATFSGHGGGVWIGTDDDPTCTGSASATFIGCTFQNNNKHFGAGAYVAGASVIFLDCDFSGGNGAFGGGVFNAEGSVVLDGCRLIANRASGRGGAVYNRGGSAIIRRTTFRGNNSYYGGAIYNVDGGVATVVSCTFLANWTAANGGAALNSANSRADFMNCTFSGNFTAAPLNNAHGGGIATGQGSETTVVHCTFFGNHADYGGGIGNGGITTLRNSILWGNTATNGDVEWEQLNPQVPNVFMASVSVAYTAIEGWTGLFGGAGNIGANPLFAAAVGMDGIAGTVDDNLRLTPGSPAIDAGDNAAIPAGITTDLDGNLRIVNGTVDLGAYEFFCPSGTWRLYGDVDDSGSVNFTDISLLVQVFQGIPTSISFEDADIAPCGGDGNVNFNDISAAVETFIGVPRCANLCL